MVQSAQDVSGQCHKLGHVTSAALRHTGKSMKALPSRAAPEEQKLNSAQCLVPRGAYQALGWVCKNTLTVKRECDWQGHRTQG